MNLKPVERGVRLIVEITAVFELVGEGSTIRTVAIELRVESARLGGGKTKFRGDDDGSVNALDMGVVVEKTGDLIGGPIMKRVVEKGEGSGAVGEVNSGVASDITHGKMGILEVCEMGVESLEAGKFLRFHEVNSAIFFEKKGKSDFEEGSFNCFVNWMRVREVAVEGQLKSMNGEVGVSEGGKRVREGGLRSGQNGGHRG